MTVKPSKDQIIKNIIYNSLMPILMLIIPIDAFFFRNSSVNMLKFVLFAEIAFGCMWIRIIQLTIATGKTCEYSANGCTAYFLCFHKSYAWDQLVTRRMEDFSHELREKYLDPGLGDGVIFTLKRKYRRHPLRYNIASYCAWHPFSRFYVTFPLPVPVENYNFTIGEIHIVYSQQYVVDREKFLVLLDEWGVTWEDCR